VPFTLAHGAAALPFRRFHLVFSALLVGTFAPDFEYLVSSWLLSSGVSSEQQPQSEFRMVIPPKNDSLGWSLSLRSHWSGGSS
jgi:hypothetical protein